MSSEVYKKRTSSFEDAFVECDCLPARWFLPNGYYVRAYTQSGRVKGFLTDRKGFGGFQIAQVFSSAQEASDAAFAAKCRFFDVMHNANPRLRK